jgi:hypothetical protein
MDTATKKWISELFSSDEYYTIFIPQKIDLQKTTVNTWLDIISRNINKKALGDYFSANGLRALKKLPKIAKGLKIENEYILMSSFLNVMIDREEITTEHVDGSDMEEFTKNPYDFDYQISPKNFQKVLEDEWSHIFDREENKREIFSVKTNSNTTPPPCPNCNGEGFFRCENCEGSGREQYTDGNFANGDERIKTGQCSNCYGQGKIECETCNGAGKQQIYANTYQTIKRFEDRKRILRYDCLSSSGGFYCKNWYSWRWDNNIDNSYQSNLQIKKNLDIWRNMDNDEIENCIDKLYQNSKEIIIDNESESVRNVLAEIGNKYSTLYKENKKQAHLLWKNYELEKGQLGCSLAKHYAMPAVKITFTDTIEENEHDFFIVEDLRENEKGVVCLFNSFPEVSFFKSLFL